jgi:hypothetical protein
MTTTTAPTTTEQPTGVFGPMDEWMARNGIVRGTSSSMKSRSRADSDEVRQRIAALRHRAKALGIHLHRQSVNGPLYSATEVGQPGPWPDRVPLWWATLDDVEVFFDKWEAVK